MEVTLSARPRPLRGKGPARRARMAGLVPGILYGPALDPLPLSVDAKAMQHALHTEAGGNVMITLELEGRKYLAMPREVHRHPIRGTLMHVDFVNISRDVAMTAAVPINLVGDAHGVRMGGMLEHHLRDLNIEALPSAIPTGIDVDVSGLDIGQHIRVSDLTVPPAVTVLTQEDEVVASVVEPKTIVVEEPEAPEPVEITGTTEPAPSE
ncbi:MAG: 50S ribosomal protein L25 [Actinomycetota bacterium]